MFDEMVLIEMALIAPRHNSTLRAFQFDGKAMSQYIALAAWAPSCICRQFFGDARWQSAEASGL